MDFIAVNHRDEFDRAVAELSAKHERLCVKPAVSVYGLGFRILDTQRDGITQLLKGIEYQISLQELRQGMENTPQFATLLVMEHLGGPEWSVDCAGRYSELLCAVQRKKSQLAGYGQTIDNNIDSEWMDGMMQALPAYREKLLNVWAEVEAYCNSYNGFKPRLVNDFDITYMASSSRWMGLKIL